MSAEHELEVALELARAGGELLRAEAARPQGPRGSGSHADVDDEICALLVDGLAQAFPADTVRSEELPEREGSSGRAWIIDPHDGTSHFLRGHRDTSISLALATGGRLLLGIVYVPLESPWSGPQGLLASWAEGDALRRDGQAVTPSPPPADLDAAAGAALLVTPRLRDERLRRNQELAEPLRLAPCGSIATRLALVALGEAAAGLTLRNALFDWDYAGGQALLRAAGGALVGSDGARIEWEGDRPARRGVQDFFAGRSLGLAAQVARRYRER